MISDKTIINKIIKAYEDGQSMNSIATKFDTHPTTIRRVLQKNGVELRHDSTRGGVLYVRHGEKLIEWAKAQGRLVTKEELAAIAGTKRLSPSYFIKYPELGQYVKSHAQKSISSYSQMLYDWLRKNNIPYKPKDRTTLSVAVDALLLEEYTGIAIQVVEKASNMSKKIHENNMQAKAQKAKEAGVVLIFLNKEHFENLDDIKPMIDAFKR